MDDDADMAGKIEHTLPNVYSITGHRRDADVETLFQLRIEGKDGRQAWVPERAVQEDSEMALFAYWDSVADGRLGAMAHKDLWHPFRIEGHRKTHRGGQLLVYWVGSPDRSWQYERVIRKADPKLVKDYRVSQYGATWDVLLDAPVCYLGRVYAQAAETPSRPRSTLPTYGKGV
ncbi:hypothetical protein CABS02_15410 [Colletotrichum abscissum]|uniref:Chromo domain-containing protein n=1 Tax=Colletotrichum abscissum TaxID=1671311 RepID=A0A9P9WZ96_9PEZI|nr:hypothetical protein CABS02_15410 [Colletotrichum abscissum]